MAQMIAAIKSVLIAECKLALAAYFPASFAAEYVNERFEDGRPTAMHGQWYCGIHGVNSRSVDKMPGNQYVEEVWSAAITVSVRSSFAPDDRIDTPMTTYDGLTRAITNRLRNDPWGIMASINTAFNQSLTNGLLLPFVVRDPMPVKQEKNPAWLVALAKKKTSQKEAFAGIIQLSGALQRQPTGDIA